jgi:hypothetical protein
LTLPLTLVGVAINGLKVAGSAALFPAIAGGELTVRVDCCIPKSTMFATLIARVEVPGLDEM